MLSEFTGLTRFIKENLKSPIFSNQKALQLYPGQVVAHTWELSLVHYHSRDIFNQYFCKGERLVHLTGQMLYQI